MWDVTDATRRAPVPAGATGCPPCWCSPWWPPRSRRTASTWGPATSAGPTHDPTQRARRGRPTGRPGAAGLDEPAAGLGGRPPPSAAPSTRPPSPRPWPPGLRDKTSASTSSPRSATSAATAPVWTHGDDQFLPASTTKLLTSAAALEAARPRHPLHHPRRPGATPREVVLVGGGDPYLASRPLTPEERADDLSRARRRRHARPRRGAERRRPQAGCGWRTTTPSSPDPTNNPKWRADYVPDDIVSPDHRAVGRPRRLARPASAAATTRRSPRPRRSPAPCATRGRAGRR